MAATTTISVSIDNEADAAYISLSHDPVHRTVSVSDEVNVDLNDMGVVVGIEVLSLAADIPYADLIALHHVHSVVVENLRLIQPSVGSFISRVQAGTDDTEKGANAGLSADFR